MKRLCILALLCLCSIISFGQTGQHIPYPIIFIHGLNGANTTWDEMKAQLQGQGFEWSFGGNMDFNLNYDGSQLLLTTAEDDVHDFNRSLVAGDFYTINFNVDRLGNFGTGNNLSNQAAIVKQGLAVSKAIQHVLAITHRDKVILVGHSMGGLAAREYLQDSSLWYEPFVNHHVAKLCTIGTPHGGSNTDFTFLGDYIGSFTPWAKGMDVLSEAVRDLRTKYFYSRNPGVFLFGGEENLLSMADQFGILFYNADVNCNGQEGDNIKGLNSKKMPDVPYSCVIGTDYKYFIPLVPGYLNSDGDGIVTKENANLNNFLPEANADTFIVHDVFHTNLTGQIKEIMEGMDEPDVFPFAYNIDLDKTYSGNITMQSGNNYTAIDIDDYAVNLTSGGKLSINVNNIPVNVFTVSVYSDNNLTKPIYSENRGGSNFMNIEVPISQPGKYYIILAGVPTSDSWTTPYSFQVGLTNAQPPQGSCLTVLTAVSGNFSDGSASADYANNTNCSWLIQPQDASAITLHFNNFSTEADNDTVNIYNGSDSTYPLLGKFSGTTLPPYIVSSGGSMFVKFKTNGSVTAAGWEASYNAEIGDATPVHIPGKINGYRYWFDGNINNGSTINLAENSALSIDEMIEANSFSLYKGFHSFSLMAKQTDGSWSAPVSGLFFYYKNADPAIYEYWYDSLYADRKTISIPDTSNFVLDKEMLDASKLTNGYHQFNIRLKPNGGFWTPIQNEMIFKSGNAIITEKQLAQMEYWFDSSYDKAIRVTTADTADLNFNNQLLDASALSDGYHQVNYRFRSNDSLWSAVQNSMIYKHQKFTIDAMEYWFDSGAGNKKKVTFEPTENLVLNNQLLDASELTNGFHQLNISFLSDGTNISSSVVTAMIFKRGNDLDSAMDVKKIRYWFNGNFSTVKEMAVSGQGGIINSFIDCSGLPTGKNYFSYQTMDNGNIWSATIIDSFMNANIPLIVSGKVFLQGAYNVSTGSMNNTLNTSGLLTANALNQPYNSTGFGYQGTEHVAVGFFNSHADIVDWVLVELRDAATPSNVIATRAALVRQDGALIETDGTTSGIKFLGIAPGNYYVAIRHRNHLGIRSASVVDFSSGSGSYDFTTSANKSYQNQTYTSTVSIGGIWAMRSGDANSNGNVKYNGPANDQSRILNSKLAGSLSNILNNVYSPEDINMDGKVRWNGPGNEQNFLLNTLLQGSLTSIFMQQL